MLLSRRSLAGLPGVIALTLSVVLAPLPDAGAAPPPVIQPGVALDFGSSLCTANFVYDGGGSVYLGSARHCSTDTSGVGSPVTLVSGTTAGIPIETIGHIAYISAALDFCLIQLDAGVLGQVSAALAGHPDMPTGVAATDDVRGGDALQFSGHGVGFDTTSQTQQQRTGIFGFFLSGARQGEYTATGAVSPGDSGGPTVDTSDGNRALGIVDDIAVDASNRGAGTMDGVTVQALLADAASNGFPISLRTV